jgi:hypothetical protein
MEYSTKMYFQLTTARCIVLQKNKKKNTNKHTAVQRIN